MAGFTLFPAIDLRGGRCVRLEQGSVDKETVYGADPVAVAERFRAAGADWVHVVDLDAALGTGSNRTLIGDLTAGVSLRVQTGGGLRTEDDLAAVFDAGAARAVIGTAAVERPQFVRDAVRRWGAERIAVALDARDRNVASRGWEAEGGADLYELGSNLAESGVQTLIYTDISRDGMLSGPNLKVAAELASHTGAEVVVSGGVRDLDDVGAVAGAGGGITGVIIGKALYEGKLDLAEALAYAQSAGTA